MADDKKKEEQDVVDVTTATETKEEAKSKEEWDKERQKVDQAEANVRKIAEEKLALSEQLGANSERAESLQAKVDELKGQLADKQTQKDQEAKLDPDLHDPTLIKVIDDLKAKLEKETELRDEVQKQVKGLEEKAGEYEQKIKTDEEKTAQNERREKVLSKLDERYGAKFRNDALKMAQKKVDESGNAPVGELAVYWLLEEYYEELAKKAPKETKDKVRVDTGEAGVHFKEGDITEGNREDVWEQIKKKLPKGGFTMPTP